ncbi:tetratricopeptide repeat protein [Pseudoalteromonas gelatinilytica]|uniref:tetratricopeptide repeat protein n=1 Tax=Pseudoalteromonas gelatinilytica TaxID=1703256 RepID=UPI0007C4A7FF|nr:tetratricopeptide repeat protein [Pseudoalteromonas gelatinilytica]
MLLFNTAPADVFYKKQKTCPHCHSEHYSLSNHSRVLRFTILPIMPLSINYQRQCDDCGYVTPAPWYSLPALELASFIKYFIGLFIIVYLFTKALLGANEQTENEQTYLSEPKLFDTYFVYSDKFTGKPKRINNLKVAQLVEFDDKSMTFRIANYTYKYNKDIEIAMRTSLLVQDDYFSSKTLTFSKQQIKQLYDDGSIYKIMRPELYSLFGGFVMHPPRPKPLYAGVKLDKYNQQGITYFKDGLYKEALNSFTLSAEGGYSWGQLNLGQMYRDGQGTEINNEEAAYWLNKATLQGNPKAKIELAELCLSYDCSKLDTQ